MFALLCWGYSPSALAQHVSGRTLDAQTLAPLPYVNVGVLDGERGTVSDGEGYFGLDLAGLDSSQVLRFSFIGYEHQDFSLSDLSHRGRHLNVELQARVLDMPAVHVFPKKFSEKIVGNPNPPKRILAGFQNDSLGYEMGIRVKIPRRPTLLKELRLHGLAMSYDTVFYRLNVYEMLDGEPGPNILNQPIYITLSQAQVNGQDQVSLDLVPYHIMVHDDFVISLEYVRELGEGRLEISSGFLNGKTYFRKTSQGLWHSAPLGIGMSVLTRFEQK